MNLSVEVISDVICPWCFIGKRRLEKAIAVYNRPVKVRWLVKLQVSPDAAAKGWLYLDEVMVNPVAK